LAVRNIIEPVDLKSLSAVELFNFCQQIGLQPYRAKQLLYWIYRRAITEIDEITVFPKKLRKELMQIAYISSIKLLKRQQSLDGTEKFLFALQDNERIESVLIPEKQRLTLCVSVQIGCPVGCSFCLTGKIDFKRNLKAHEIVDQFLYIQRLIRPKRITNIVFMGMGEPLLNLDNVKEALWRITSLIGISRRRITVSTSGIVPAIKSLPEEAPKVKLAISLNATTNKVRSMIMPINDRYPIEELLKVCKQYPLEPRQRITFEYVLLKGINDSIHDAKRLIKLLSDIPSKINLIPYNPYQGAEYEPPNKETIKRFISLLESSPITVTLRKSKGRDISGACGQLSADYLS